MKVDWVTALEAAYAPADDDSSWAQRFVEAAAPLFRHDASSIAITGVSVAPDMTSARVVLSGGKIAGQQSVGDEDVLFKNLGREGVRSVYYPPHIVTTMASLRKELSPDIDAFMGDFLSRVGLKDLLGLVVHPEPGLVCVVSVGLLRSEQMSRHRAQLLTRLGLHLETGLRLRRRSAKVRAVIDPRGRVLHREDGAPETAALSGHVARVELARTKRARREPDAINLWSALIAGKASLVERTEGNQRYYWVVDNEPLRHPLRALSPRELDVLSFTVRGLSAKLVGYGLGISASAVSSHLASAAAKVGTFSRTELVRLAALFTRDPRAGLADEEITEAESEVLTLLRLGLSNSDIGRIRNRSFRTIGNQVSSLLRKTGAPSRRALVALDPSRRDSRSR